jgi:hypothetical protein
MTTLTGTVIGGVVVFDGGKTLPEGTAVEVVVLPPTPPSTGQSKPTLAERLLRHAGQVPDLPPDLAEQHDHYLYGTPKR